MVKDKCPDAVFNCRLERFKGETVAIDISIWAHTRFRNCLPGYVNENDERDDFQIDWEKLRRTWLSEMLDIGFIFLLAEVTPLFIFDGKAKNIKSGEHEDREKRRNRSNEIYEERKQAFQESLGKFESNQAFEKYRSSFINKTRFEFKWMKELKEKLIALGFPVLQSIEETDFLVAALYKDGIINTVFGNDTDMAIYGVRFLITDYRRGDLIVIDTHKFLEEIHFSQDELIDLAILLGCDYNESIHGCGMDKSFKMIDHFGKLELIPVKLYSPKLNRTVVRSRFKNIPSWEEVVDKKSSTNYFEFQKDKLMDKGYEISSSLKKPYLWLNWQRLIKDMKNEEDDEDERRERRKMRMCEESEKEEDGEDDE